VRSLKRFGALYLLVVLFAVGVIAFLRMPRAFVLLGGAAPVESGRIAGATSGRGHQLHLNASPALVCADCHDLEVNGFTKPSPERCKTCHEARGGAHKKLTVPIHASANAKAKGADNCITCHSFVPKPGDDKDPWNCLSCHKEKQGDKAAISVHAKEQCGTCHRPHDDKPTQAADCKTCHDGTRAAIHPLKDVKLPATAEHPAMRGQPDCNDCHKPHEKAPRGADACTGCHFENKPVVPETAIFSGGHKCTGCHTSHEKGASVGTACITCHKGQRVVGMDKVPQHANCQSCHNKHNVMGGPEKACTTCHTGPHKGNNVDVSRGCTSCHSVHGPEALIAQGNPSDCATCHKIAQNDRSFHDGKTQCASCHATHGSNPLGPKLIAPCAQCHEKKTEMVSAGHANCKNCHTPHNPLPPKAACTSCHAPEAQTVPRGHAQCTTCHDPHSGQKPGCTTGCHQDKKQAIHAKVDGSCQTCHRPHGPKGVASPPACVTCHQAQKLPALHSVPQHQQNCKSCHTQPHLPAQADRVTCTTCHADRKEHEKGATRCTGCHDFRGAK
jgi:hypothetical protein